MSGEKHVIWVFENSRLLLPKHGLSLLELVQGIEGPILYDACDNRDIWKMKNGFIKSAYRGTAT